MIIGISISFVGSGVMPAAGGVTEVGAGVGVGGGGTGVGVGRTSIAVGTVMTGNVSVGIGMGVGVGASGAPLHPTNRNTISDSHNICLIVTPLISS